MAFYIEVRKLDETADSVRYQYDSDGRSAAFEFDRQTGDVRFEDDADEALVVRASRAVLRRRGDNAEWPTSAIYAA